MMKFFLKYIFLFCVFGLMGRNALSAEPIRVLYAENEVVNQQRLQYAVNKLTVATQKPSAVFRFGETALQKGDLLLGVLGTTARWQELVPAKLLDDLKNKESFVIYRKDSTSPLIIVGKDGYIDLFIVYELCNLYFLNYIFRYICILI